jgi:pyruvate formate lyase activating enzyme
MSAAGIVFNLQRYSVHDGPGIRTVVFLKGCPLACRWCSNPESQAPAPQLAYHRERCLGLDQCDRCLAACAPQAILRGEDGRPSIDRRRCNDCLDCARVCPPRALRGYGEVMTVADCLEAVEAEEVFYARSGGGLTLSGGEPLYQTGFTLALLAEARRRHIHTAMETCGYVRWEDLAAACAQLDFLLYDLKSMDAEKHRAFTGVSNALILENLGRVRRRFTALPVRVRTPIVPGFNDRVEDIRPILEHLRALSGPRFEALGYHRLGRPKYGYLGREFPMADGPLGPEAVNRIRRLAAEEFPDLAPRES